MGFSTPEAIERLPVVRIDFATWRERLMGRFFVVRSQYPKGMSTVPGEVGFDLAARYVLETVSAEERASGLGIPVGWLPEYDRIMSTPRERLPESLMEFFREAVRRAERGGDMDIKQAVADWMKADHAAS